MTSDKLRPLTPAEAEEFERRRISRTSIQVKCTSCGAWFETVRHDVAFRETFDCDCGARLSYDVPALETTLIIPTDEQIASIGDPDQRFDTGMKVGEAIRRAREWWTRTGAREMALQGMRQAKKPTSPAKGLGGAFASLDPDNANFLPSGIIAGLDWDALDKREQLMVVKVWHHYYVRKRDVIGGADQEAKFGKLH